jgi:hypothetical protein
MVFTQPGGICSTVITGVLSETVLLAELNYEIGNRSYQTHTLPHSIVIENIDQGILVVLNSSFGQYLQIPFVLLIGAIVLFLWLIARCLCRRKADLDNTELLRNLSDRSIEVNWPQIRQLGKQLAIEWRTEHWHMSRQEEKLPENRFALQSVLSDHEDFADYLEDGNQLTTAVLVYAGLLVSCRRGHTLEEGKISKGLHDHIPPWTVLEGKYLDEPDSKRETRYTVGDSLRSAESRRVFLRTWSKFKGPDEPTSETDNSSNPGKKEWIYESVKAWRKYAQLVECALSPDQCNDELTDLLQEIYESWSDEDLLKERLESIKDNTAKSGEFERHPVLRALALPLTEL